MGDSSEPPLGLQSIRGWEFRRYTGCPVGPKWKSVFSRALGLGREPPALKLASLQGFSTYHDLRREERLDGEEARLFVWGPFTSLPLSILLPPHTPQLHPRPDAEAFLSVAGNPRHQNPLE